MERQWQDRIQKKRRGLFNSKVVWEGRVNVGWSYSFDSWERAVLFNLMLDVYRELRKVPGKTIPISGK